MRAFHGKDYDGQNSGTDNLFMFEILAIACFIVAPILLLALSLIDLKHWILPDELNLALGITGALFHFSTAYRYIDMQTMIIGGLVGAGLLYGIRYFANKHYGRDALGLGDVKLLGAAGLWLGTDGVLQAITLGAMAGLVHGVIYAACLSFKNKTAFTIRDLSIPAGPGFAVGILCVGIYLYHDFFKEIINVFSS
ncbi:MAG: prepilin peptidase [Micavibrio aeruginosavorus]|uniref:Prepilin peptidase n=1 Tax=Micavibrio aeruginosavorus TaxID=349221 RepID=A0A2W5N9M6_9BACT|nr:MAG: prepilin peptidase [Micavibrio aeruginosavorus]